MYAGVLFLLFVICRKNSRCTFSNISIFSNPIISQEYHNDPKFSDKYAWANSADPDQTASFGVLEFLQQLFWVSEYLGNLR